MLFVAVKRLKFYLNNKICTYLERSYITKILLLTFRLDRIKHFRKNKLFWLWFALILVLITAIHFYSRKKHYKPFIFKKRFTHHRRVMSYSRFKSMYNPLVDFEPTPFPKYGGNLPFCFFKNMSLGPRTVKKTPLAMTWVEQQLPMVHKGGFHAPEHCRSRHKVAIFVPYRNRYKNLIIFLYYMHRLWQKQYLQYRLFIIQQYGNYKFNKGVLYNAAFIETQRYGKWDCLVFHDVDLIPLDERVLYTCPRNPTHMSPAVDYRNFTLQYPTLFGGVTTMKPGHFYAVNGYSNYYWDWGAEDDDMFVRLVGARLALSRLHSSIARFATLPHKRQPENPERWTQLETAKSRFRSEGLNTVQYRLMAIYKRKLFTHIIIDVNPFNHKY